MSEPKPCEQGVTAVRSSEFVVPHRMTFQKAFDEERKSWRWATMTPDKETLVLAFCACIALRMKGSSMDEVMRHNDQAEASGARGRPIANLDAPAALPPAHG